jgi:hypothetical protein
MEISASNIGRVILASLTILMLIASPLPSFAQAGGKPEVFSPDSSPYGRTYGEWTAEWWKWLISMPTEENPLNDPTGERCAEQQSGPVWFLVGSGGGKAERSCTIPAGVAVLIPAINVECSFAEDASLKTEDDLRACAMEDQDLVTQYGGTLDGVDLEVHRVQSPAFNLTFPANNIFTAQEGPTRAVSEGYWIFLKPLSPGEHELHAEGLLVDYTVTGPVNLVEDSTYDLTVEASSSRVFAETVAFVDKSFEFPVNSMSTVPAIEFDEQGKQLSFTVSGESGGTTWAPISWLLEGPYTVMMDGTEVTDYDASENSETGEITLMLFHSGGTHDVVVTGTNAVPEFPYAIFILLLLAR